MLERACKADPYKERRPSKKLSASVTYVDFVPVGDFLIFFGEELLYVRIFADVEEHPSTSDVEQIHPPIGCPSNRTQENSLGGSPISRKCNIPTNIIHYLALTISSIIISSSLLLSSSSHTAHRHASLLLYRNVEYSPISTPVLLGRFVHQPRGVPSLHQASTRSS